MGYFISDCHGEDSIGYTQTHYTDSEQINRCPYSLMLQCLGEKKRRSAHRCDWEKKNNDNISQTISFLLLLLASSMVVHGFGPWSDQTEVYDIGICFFSPKHCSIKE
jgi:hypothetical protein